MENYFNYFTEIEEHFQARRGGILLLSSLDWALIESWKDAGIPLEAVLRGIDTAFDKWEKRPTKTRKVNGLAYCTQEVLGAAEDIAEAGVGAERKEKSEAKVDNEAVAGFFVRNALALEKAKIPAQASSLVTDDAKALQDLAAGIRAGAPVDLEELERRMTVMEEKLFAVLFTVTADDDIVAIRAQADRELAPYRSKMTGPQIEQLLKQYVNKKLLERYALPRLSLFYM
ncbi:MAG TPA: hypothetical protein VN622_00175 [Clostridia bacterium]|nr:hypothetical protein [Clostridia bacterium]